MKENIQHSDFSAFHLDEYRASSHAQGHELPKQAPSIAAVRRGLSRRTAASSEAPSPSLKAPENAPRGALGMADKDVEALSDEQMDERLQLVLSRLSGQIEALDRKLDVMSESVNFTEAYVVVEMVNRIAAAVEERIETVQSQHVRSASKFRRLGALFLLVLVPLVIACLITEMRNDWVSNTLDGWSPFW